MPGDIRSFSHAHHQRHLEKQQRSRTSGGSCGSSCFSWSGSTSWTASTSLDGSGAAVTSGPPGSSRSTRSSRLFQVLQVPPGPPGPLGQCLKRGLRMVPDRTWLHQGCRVVLSSSIFSAFCPRWICLGSVPRGVLQTSAAVKPPSQTPPLWSLKVPSAGSTGFYSAGNICRIHLLRMNLLLEQNPRLCCCLTFDLEKRIKRLWNSRRCPAHQLTLDLPSRRTDRSCSI